MSLTEYRGFQHFLETLILLRQEYTLIPDHDSDWLKDNEDGDKRTRTPSWAVVAESTAPYVQIPQHRII